LRPAIHFDHHHATIHPIAVSIGQTSCVVSLLLSSDYFHYHTITTILASRSSRQIMDLFKVGHFSRPTPLLSFITANKSDPNLHRAITTTQQHHNNQQQHHTQSCSSYPIYTIDIGPFSRKTRSSYAKFHPSFSASIRQGSYCAFYVHYRIEPTRLQSNPQSNRSTTSLYVRLLPRHALDDPTYIRIIHATTRVSPAPCSTCGGSSDFCR
jgi:hypothetical protein